MASGTEDTLAFRFSIPSLLTEQLVAELDALGFEGFLEDDHGIAAYIPVSAWDPGYADALRNWMKHKGIEPVWQKELIKARDWNEPWEQSIKPVLVEPFYVRPGWADAPPEGLIDVIVDPKMSFGTGHHESTRLVLKSLPAIVESGDRVLDAGAGTAILSIAAAKLGASSAIAFDIDAWACENAGENISRNAVQDRVVFREGTLDVVPESDFDVILANINRNVLLEYLPAFASKLRNGGKLVLAGLLLDDRENMVKAAAGQNLVLTGEGEEGMWWSGQFAKA